MNYRRIREQVYAVTMKAVEANLIRLSAGNLSARTEDGYLAITPSGIKYDVLRPEDIAIVDLDGNPIDAPCRPSSETPMHTIILRSLPSVGAVFHTHSPYAITFAALEMEIPPINLELFACGAPIPVAEWACPATEEAGLRVVALFQKRPELRVVLQRNHGLVAIGADLEQAFELAYDAEVGMQIYHQALQIGTPIAMTPQQMQQVYEIYRKFKTPPAPSASPPRA